MAFPWIFESNWEQGTNAEWDSESDTGSKLDYPHYSVLSFIPGAPAPYRGAYVARIDLSSGDTNDHTLTSATIAIADQSTAFFRWYMYVSADFTASADDTFNILELQQAGGTIEQSVGMRVTAASNLLEIGVGDGTAPTDFANFPRGKWVNVEVQAKVSTTGAGLMTLFLDETQVVSITSLTQAAAVGKGVLGTQNTLSTTTGKIYLDQFVVDDSRIYGIPIRYQSDVLLTKTGHVFVGQGKIDNASLLSGAGTDCVLQIYDTDVNNTNHVGRMKLELKNTANNELVDPAGVPVEVQRGCYVVLSGTNPRAIVKVGSAQGYWSDGRVKQHGQKRIPSPGNW